MQSTSLRVVVAGGGIGGLAAALACVRAGHTALLAERAERISEVGAGIQLGPNAVRRLAALGLADGLAAVACEPQRLRVRDARSGATLGQLPLGQAMRRRYGQPYLTIHRADLQALLLAALQREPAASLSLGAPATGWEMNDDAICLRGERFAIDGDLLVLADGVWSPLRQRLLGDGPPRRAGHIALRTLIEADALPGAAARDEVQAWLGERMHAVAYPVRAGRAHNLVVIVHEGERLAPDLAAEQWNGEVEAAQVQAALADVHADLAALVRAAPEWRYWALHDRPPLSGPQQMARERIALLGDAAHPMRPYLAQGAAMAIEDAAALGRALAAPGVGRADVPGLLAGWAEQRAPRVARVQARSVRNGEVFHLTGPMRLARNAAMAALGERLLDLPWLYGG